MAIWLHRSIIPYIQKLKMSQFPKPSHSDSNCSQPDSETQSNKKEYSTLDLDPNNLTELEMAAPSSASRRCISWRWIIFFIFVGALILVLAAVYPKQKPKEIEVIPQEEEDDQQIYVPIKETPDKPQEKPVKIECKPFQQQIIGSQAQEGTAKADLYQPHVVVDVEYARDSYALLPINPLRKNSEGKGIEEVLYKDEETRDKRIRFTKQRAWFVSSFPHLKNIFLTKYNIVNDQKKLNKAIKENQRDWLRLQSKFGLSSIDEQLPMCIVVPGHNNNADFRIEGNLNSIFTQNYSSYKVVIVDDASSDGSGQLYRDYLSFHAIDKALYTFIENSRQVTALQNIYFAALRHCSRHSVVVTLDADDEFIGRNVLKVFNWAYQTNKAGVVYSNFFWYRQGKMAQQGFTVPYTQVEKKERLYREVPMRFSQLRSFRAELLHQIDPRHLQDGRGEFFKSTYDQALFFPLMELSCGRVYKIENEYHYLYNMWTKENTPTNDYVCLQRQVEHIVRKAQKLDCYQPFDQKMQK